MEKLLSFVDPSPSYLWFLYRLYFCSEFYRARTRYTFGGRLFNSLLRRAADSGGVAIAPLGGSPNFVQEEFSILGWNATTAPQRIRSMIVVKRESTMTALVCCALRR